MPPPESTDVLLEAWQEALGDALAQERASWQRERALIEAQAAQSIAELRSQVLELERKHEASLQQKLLDVETMVRERMASVRDGVGIPGDRGERGEIGLQGPAGPVGRQGERGYGIEGKEGKEGRQGPQGAKGDSVKGERGEAGRQGPQGKDGKDGKDGLSIIGPEGREGLRGLRGESGTPGRDGERGERGEPGRPGVKGDPGARGEPGERGEPGQSISGPPGCDGSNGASGLPGIDGKDGKDGAPGAPGKLPRVKHWQPETVFYDGEVVSHARGAYQALKDTSQRPGSGEDWMCIAAGGLDAKTPQVCGTFDASADYGALDIVVSNGGGFIARHDQPGLCPGDGWQLIARQGQRGVAGEKGERGDPGLPGPKGEPAAVVATLKGWTVDRKNFVAVPLMSDGSRGPTLELRDLFEQFQNDVG